MALPEEVYREFVRRSHRLLAAYLAMHAWRHDLDCVVLDRNQIVKFWGLKKRVEGERRDWLKQDVAPYFPHVQILSFVGGKFASIYLSRRPFRAGAFSGAASDAARATALTAAGTKTAKVTLPSEQEMLTALTSAIHGLSVFPR